MTRVPPLGGPVENYLERVFTAPTAPTTLVATAVATNQINLNWTDTSAVESGFEIERAAAAGGHWIQIADVRASTVSYSDKNLFPGEQVVLPGPCL